MSNDLNKVLRVLREKIVSESFNHAISSKSTVFPKYRGYIQCLGSNIMEFTS